MRRTLALVPALALLIGCGGSSSTTNSPAPGKDPVKAVTDGAKDLAQGAKDKVDAGVKDATDKVDAGKAELAKLAEIATKEFPAIQTRINGLSGDAKTKAADAFDALKKLIEDAKAAVGDPTKLKATMETVAAKLADLKKQVGL